MVPTSLFAHITEMMLVSPVIAFSDRRAQSLPVDRQQVTFQPLLPGYFAGRSPKVLVGVVIRCLPWLFFGEADPAKRHVVA
jgi:hypothetical protein